LPREKPEKLEPGDLTNLVPFDEKFLSGFTAKVMQLVLKTGFEIAKQRMDILFVAAINVKSVEITKTYLDAGPLFRYNFQTHFIAYMDIRIQFKNTVYRLIVNGHRESIREKRPWCWWKIALWYSQLSD
jgi:hypothetical protein